MFRLKRGPSPSRTPQWLRKIDDDTLKKMRNHHVTEIRNAVLTIIIAVAGIKGCEVLQNCNPQDQPNNIPTISNF